MVGGGDGVVDLELRGLDPLDEDLTREGIFLNRSSIFPEKIIQTIPSFLGLSWSEIVPFLVKSVVG